MKFDQSLNDAFKSQKLKIDELVQECIFNMVVF